MNEIMGYRRYTWIKMLFIEDMVVAQTIHLLRQNRATLALLTVLGQMVMTKFEW